MNKPVIHGTKEHSALLAKTSLTHGGDPTLTEAASLYGESTSPDVIDYKIKQREIKFDRTAKEDDPPPRNEDVDVTEIPIIPVGGAGPLTVEEKKIEVSKVDEEAAKNRLDEAARRRKEKEPGQYYEEGSLIKQKVGGRSTIDDLYSEGVIKSSYTAEERDRLVFWEEGGVEVLPEGLEKIKEKKKEKKVK